MNVQVTTEALFIAGCAGAVMPGLLQWFSNGQRRRMKPEPPYLIILYMLMGGYFAGVIVAPQELYRAFIAGVLMDLTIRGARKFARNLDH